MLQITVIAIILFVTVTAHKECSHLKNYRIAVIHCVLSSLYQILYSTLVIESQDAPEDVDQIYAFKPTQKTCPQLLSTFKLSKQHKITKNTTNKQDILQIIIYNTILRYKNLSVLSIYTQYDTFMCKHNFC